MPHIFKLFLVFLLLFCTLFLQAQDLKTSVNDNKAQQDSLRKKLDGSADSVVFSSKYIRYTTTKLTKDSIQTIPIDTGLYGIQNFSVIAQPRRPTVGLGNLGLAAMPLMFEPVKTIGFDAGFKSLDYYTLTNDDVKFYQARTPFTNLYYVNGTEKEQVFSALHTQNIKKNWNVGASYARIGADGYYARQRGDHLNASIFSWYQAPKKRYNLWASTVFNTLKAKENGAVINPNIFTQKGVGLEKIAEPVRLNTANQLFRKTALQLKQTYFVGRIDSTQIGATQKILPTNKISHILTYSNDAYSFKKNEKDDFSVLPKGLIDSIFTNDSVSVKNLRNEFIYSFFLRAKGKLVTKNELKIDAGIRHDYYDYAQFGLKADNTNYYKRATSFQNITLLGSAGYRFSNKIDLNVDLQQIFQGRHIGDFLYEAKSNVLLSKAIGQIVLGAYFQNKSPEEIYNRFNSNHYKWVNNFDRTKTANLSFKYINEKLALDAGVEYFLITNHLFFVKNGVNAIAPKQQSAAINMLKVSVGKRFSLKGFYLDNFLVYQKSDNPDVFRMPEFYTFNSIYKEQTFFKVLKTQIGFDVRYNTSFLAASYSPVASQFYNGNEVTFASKPVIDIWVKAGLRRANLFLKYDYFNQGWFSPGYYTVNKYAMPDRLLKFGVNWNFYD